MLLRQGEYRVQPLTKAHIQTRPVEPSETRSCCRLSPTAIYILFIQVHWTTTERRSVYGKVLEGTFIPLMIHKHDYR